jgi:hypothetical protein
VSCLGHWQLVLPLMLTIEPLPRKPPAGVVLQPKATSLCVPSAKFTRASQLMVALGRLQVRDHPPVFSLKFKSLQHDWPLVGVVQTTLTVFEYTPSHSAADIAGFALAIDALALHLPWSRTSTKHNAFATTT